MNVLVVGAGAVGSMAVWQLTQQGHRVTVLEQFALDHDQGSSYGESRIVRRVYDDPFYTALMAEAYELWDELQAQWPREELWRRSSGVFFGPASHPQIAAARAALEASHVPYEQLSRAACQERFPALRLREDEVALYEPSMGYARASRCVRAAVQLAQRAGAIFHEDTPVRDISTKGDLFRAQTEAGDTFEAERLLLCAGSWTGTLLGRVGLSLPLKVVRKTYIHLQPARHAEAFEVGRFPVWIDAATFAYGFPHLGVPGVKLAFHAGGESTDPDHVARELREDERDQLRAYAAQRFPDLSRDIAHEKVCLYTNTPDEDFLVDAMPHWPGAFLVGGLSGHGFKFAPLLGRIAARLLTESATHHDLSRFALARLAPMTELAIT